MQGWIYNNILHGDLYNSKIFQKSKMSNSIGLIDETNKLQPHHEILCKQFTNIKKDEEQSHLLG